jgi:hypothetical protein
MLGRLDNRDNQTLLKAMDVHPSDPIPGGPADFWDGAAEEESVVPENLGSPVQIEGEDA